VCIQPERFLWCVRDYIQSEKERHIERLTLSHFLSEASGCEIKILLCKSEPSDSGKKSTHTKTATLERAFEEIFEQPVFTTERRDTPIYIYIYIYIHNRFNPPPGEATEWATFQ
jgi:hypothetical protein